MTVVFWRIVATSGNRPFPVNFAPSAVAALASNGGDWTCHPGTLESRSRGAQSGFTSIKLIDVVGGVPGFGPPGYETGLLYVAGLLTLVFGGAGPLAVDTL